MGPTTPDPVILINKERLMKLRSMFILTALTAAAFIWGCSDKKATAPSNRPPVLDVLGTQYVMVNQVLSLRVAASDPDGDSISLSAAGLPEHAAFTDSLNGSGSLTFAPDSGQAGTNMIQFIASDGLNADSESVNLMVLLAPLDTSTTATTYWNDGGYWETTVNATSASQYAYYGFSHRDTLTLTPEQAANDTSWNIAFERSNVILNSGVSGPGNTVAIDLASMGRMDSTDFMGFNNPMSLPDSAWTADSYSLVIDDWYSYNHNNRMLTPTRYVYIMKDANSNYVKFQIIGIDHPGMPPSMGTITILYDFAGTSPSFTGDPDTLVFDASSGGPIYVDFSAGSVTNPADPRNSTDWDLEFTNYEIHQNATIFGPGQCGAYAIWQDQTDPTDFSETPTAPTVPQAYFADSFGSVMADWYNYDGNTHTLTSKNHVYAISMGGHHCKLQIFTYYKNIGGTPVSGWYTFRWLPLD
jgi:hypothetical protein